MTLEITGDIWFWRGPAPFYFVSVPEKESAEIKAIVRLVTYGWGMIPVDLCIGKTEYRTSLWPKDGAYIVPIKASVRKAESLEEGDRITIRLEVIAAMDDYALDRLLTQSVSMPLAMRSSESCPT